MMNDSDHNLDELLKAVPVPERPTTYWDHFPQRVLARLRQAPERRPLFSIFAYPLAWAATLLMVATLGFGIWRLRQGDEGTSQDPYYAQANRYQTLIRGLNDLFPHQLQAVIEDDGASTLILADCRVIPESTPIWIQLCTGPKCRNIITFSGQQVTVNGDTLEVLQDGAGNVIVTGNQWCWSSKEAGISAGPFKMRAQML